MGVNYQNNSVIFISTISDKNKKSFTKLLVFREMQIKITRCHSYTLRRVPWEERDNKQLLGYGKTGTLTHC